MVAREEVIKLWFVLEVKRLSLPAAYNSVESKIDFKTNCVCNTHTHTHTHTHTQTHTHTHHTHTHTHTHTHKQSTNTGYTTRLKHQCLSPVSMYERRYLIIKVRNDLNSVIQILTKVNMKNRLRARSRYVKKSSLCH